MDSSAQDSCAVRERRVGAISVLSVSGVVDVLTAPTLEQAIAAAVKAAPPAVIVDLSTVEFLASAGMGVLIAAHDGLSPAVRFAVVADGPATSRPLKLVGVDDVVSLYATLDEAIAALAS